ncbi:MAG TPA: DUF2007 domain-containing protein [Flavobacteriaceae bacterium]|nr:DUF2007 domain-containing protein [Flavobacteriaceae bacterium]
MLNSEFVKLFSGNQIDTQHLKQNLEAEGIEPIIKDTNLGVNAALATDYSEYKELYVHQSELERAKAILKDTF